MSVKAVAWVLDDLQGLKPGPTLVMLALADFADERNSCFPGQERIAARARCSKRSVITYLRELQELGLVSIESRFYSNGAKGIRRSSNRYILHVGKTYSLDDAKSAPTRKSPGRTKCAGFAPTSVESVNFGLSKVQPVALIDPPVIDPPVFPSFQSSHDDSIGSNNEVFSEGVASPPGAPPVGGAGGEVSSPMSYSVSVARNQLPADIPPAVSCDDAAVEPAPATEKVRSGSIHCSSRHGGSAVVDTGSRSTPIDVELVREVLPGPMQAIPVRDYPKVAAAIRQRLEAGYSRKQITAMLAARILPDRVRHLTALIMARFRDDLPLDSIIPTTGKPSVSKWSARLSDGREITRKDLDFGLLAIDFRAAQAATDPRATGTQLIDRIKFAEAVGLERYAI